MAERTGAEEARPMRAAFDVKRIDARSAAAWLVPATGFWLALAFEIPASVTRFFHQFHPVLFLGVIVLYYLAFRGEENFPVFAGFGLTMLLFALSLSYLWTSGFSDNFLLGGLLPYKDAKNYYLGADLLLHGLPVRVAGQAVGRPLFPGFLSSLLLLAGHNLKVVLALLTQLAGIGLFLSARQVRRATGAFGGAIYIAFLYFYFQRFAGYAMSESLGFIGGCFAFAILWRAAEKRSPFDLLLGLGVLLVAVSARAGAFFIFPLLAVWAGWLFRGTKRFSLPVTSAAALVLVAGYFVANTVFPRLLGVPEGSSFGNFAYTIYGQVRGGTGWHSAIDELGTRNPSLVYQAAWRVFRADPYGFGQGIARAYTDFFLPRAGTIFSFRDDAPGWILWAVTIFLLLRGLYGLIFKLRSNVSTLLLAGFAGIFLSIPFLPPVDGGNRFYASTMPFFFALLAVGADRFAPDGMTVTPQGELFFLRFVSVSLLALTVLLPPVTLRASSLPDLDAPVCSASQRPFAITIHPGSYIDLVHNDIASCGLVPSVCYGDFMENNTELRIDDFYQQISALAASSPAGIRIIPTLNLLDGYFQYFIAPASQVRDGSNEIVSGCATRLLTENQRIFLVESISSGDE